MNEQAVAARRAYKREWAKRNPDKIRAQQERFWNKKAAEYAAAALAEKLEENERAAALEPTEARTNPEKKPANKERTKRNAGNLS